ncbi:MobC family plasmid mobilization relaxosome protein [Sphingobium indicum]
MYYTVVCMGSRNGQRLLSTWVPEATAAAFHAQARTEGGASAALRRLVSQVVDPGLHGASLDAIAPAGSGRGEQIGIRLKGEERRALNAAAAARGTSPANWVRALAIVHLAGKPQWNPAELAELREVFKELRRIGTNVNQIARALNVAQQTGQYPPHQHRAVQEAAETIRYEMRRVVAVMTGNFDYWGLPDAERPTAAPGAIERHEADVKAAEARRRRRPRRGALRYD